VAALTAIVEYDESYSEEELDALELELTKAGVSAQIQPRGARAGIGEALVCLSVFLGNVTAEILLEHAMIRLWHAILSAARRHPKLAPLANRLDHDDRADQYVIFEFNNRRVVVQASDVDDGKTNDVLLAASRLIEDDQESTRVWVWDSVSGELKPKLPDEAEELRSS
jgi:hypothetical protein